MPKTINAQGTTIAFGTSSFSMNIDSFELPEAQRNSIRTSHLGTTGAHTFMPSKLIDNGELVINGHLDPDIDPPVGAAAETITITFPLESGETTAANWQFSGYMTAYGGTGDGDDDKATARAVVKVTGAVTRTAAT